MSDRTAIEPGRKLRGLPLCTCFNLRKASRAVTQMFGVYMHSTGLGPTQFSILSLLAQMGSRSISEMAEQLVMDRTTLTRNLRPLERERLVRIVAGEDRRVRIVSLTPRGRAKFEEALPLWRRAQEEIIRRLGREHWTALIAELNAAVEASRLE